MSLAQSDAYVTADQFLTHPAAAGPSELVRGAIRVLTPASGAHNVIAGRIFVALNEFVEARELGQCFGDNAGFQLPGLVDTVRSPDGAFVSAARLPEGGIGRGWMRASPDLVVEVLSPDETAAELEAKLDDYFKSGTRVAWVVDPAARTVSVRLPNGDESVMAEGEILVGEPVLPGFRLTIARLFLRLAK